MGRFEEHRGDSMMSRGRSPEASRSHFNGGHMRGDRDEARSAIHRRMDPSRGAEDIAPRATKAGDALPNTHPDKVFRSVDMRHGAQVLMELSARGRKVEPETVRSASHKQSLPRVVEDFKSTSVRCSTSPALSVELPKIAASPVVTSEVSGVKESRLPVLVAPVPTIVTVVKPPPPTVREVSPQTAPVASSPPNSVLAPAPTATQSVAPVSEIAQPLMRAPAPLPQVVPTEPTIREVMSAAPVVERKAEPPKIKPLEERSPEQPVQKVTHMTPLLRSLVDAVNNSSLQDAPRSPKELPKKELSDKDNELLMKMLVDSKVKTELLSYSNPQLMAAFSELHEGRIKYFESWMRINEANAKMFPKFALDSGITPKDTERLGEVVELLHQVSSDRSAGRGAGAGR